MPACGKRSKAFSETLGSDAVRWSSVLRWPACLREPRFDLSTVAHFGFGGNTVDVAHARIFIASHLLQDVPEVAARNGSGRCEPRSVLEGAQRFVVLSEPELHPAIRGRSRAVVRPRGRRCAAQRLGAEEHLERIVAA